MRRESKGDFHAPMDHENTHPMSPRLALVVQVAWPKIIPRFVSVATGDTEEVHWPSTKG